MENNRDLTKKKFLFGAAFVVLCILGLLIVFLVNKDQIFTNLKETGFFEKIFGTTPAVIENHQVKHDKNEELPMREEFLVGDVGYDDFSGLKSQDSFEKSDFDEGMTLKSDFGIVDNSNDMESFVGEFGMPGTFEDPLGNVNNNINNNFSGNGQNGVGDFSGGGNADVSEGLANVDNVMEHQNGAIDSLGNALDNMENNVAVKSANVIKKDISPKSAVVANSSLDLCFVTIDGDGAVLRKMVKRAVPRSDSPLTTAINLLLEGPDVRNKEEANCRSLIPTGAKLLGARVADGVAYLNFNEEFEFNTFGVEGAIHQLEQVVYTATAFSTVNSVQFLIEGDKQEYLGSEGQWIGTPLSRANF